MSTPTPGVPITLDRPRTLRYGGRALVAIERETGKNILKGELIGDVSFTEVVVLLWAGLLHEDEYLTRDQVADLVELARIKEYIQAIDEGIAAALPAREDREPGKGRSRAR